MSLIRCPECGREISDKASSCPGCGCPITSENKVTEEAVHPIDEKIIKCSRCDFFIPASSEKCPNCSKLITIDDFTYSGVEFTYDVGEKSLLIAKKGLEPIASLLMGLSSIVFFVFGSVLLSIIFTILSISVGIIGINEKGTYGMAVAGIAIGSINAFMLFIGLCGYKIFY